MVNHYNLNFMHPQYGTTLNVDIDVNFSVQEILEQLVLSGFVGKTNAQYDLELMGQALDKQTVFASIPNLHDGAVLRVVEHLSPSLSSTPSTISHIQLHCQHPDNSLQFSASYQATCFVKEVLLRAIQQGFLIGKTTDFHVYKGVQSLEIDKSLQKQALQEGDHLQFHRIVASSEKEVAPTVTLETLQEQVKQIEKNLGSELEQLKQQLPRNQTLPNVGDLPYESLEKVVKRLRKKGKEPSLESLSLAGTSVVSYVLLVIVLLIIIVVVVLFALQGIL